MLIPPAYIPIHYGQLRRKLPPQAQTQPSTKLELSPSSLAPLSCLFGLASSLLTWLSLSSSSASLTVANRASSFSVSFHSETRGAFCVVKQLPSSKCRFRCAPCFVFFGSGVGLSFEVERLTRSLGIIFSLEAFTYVFPIVQRDTYLCCHRTRPARKISREKRQRRTVSYSTKSSGGRHSGSTSSTGCAISTKS